MADTNHTIATLDASTIEGSLRIAASQFPHGSFRDELLATAIDEIERLRAEIERLRFWLDVATNKGNIPDHAADAEDRAWAAASCQYSFAHLPSDDVRDRLTEEYREAVEAEARDNG